MSVEDDWSDLWVGIGFDICMLLGIVAALDCVVQNPNMFTLMKLKCLDQAFALHTLAWHSKIRPCLYCVGV